MCPLASPGRCLCPCMHMLKTVGGGVVQEPRHGPPPHAVPVCLDTHTHLDDHGARDVPSPGFNILCYAVHLLDLQKELQKVQGCVGSSRSWGVAAKMELVWMRIPMGCRLRRAALRCWEWGLAMRSYSASMPHLTRCLVCVALELPLYTVPHRRVSAHHHIDCLERGQQQEAGVNAF